MGIDIWLAEGNSGLWLPIEAGGAAMAAYRSCSGSYSGLQKGDLPDGSMGTIFPTDADIA